MKIYAKAKCRNCGTIFILENPDTVNLSKEEVINLLSEEMIQQTYQCAHFCNDEEIGIADGIALVIKE